MSSSTDSVLTDLNLLPLSELDDIDAAAAPDSTFDALALFTDTLFYDWDLGRFLDADSSNSGAYPEPQRPRECNSRNSNGTAAVGLEIDGGDGTGFYAATEDTTTTAAATTSSSHLTQSLSALGYDFLNFKFPDDQLQAGAAGEIQHSQSAYSRLQAAATGDPPIVPGQPPIDAVVSPQSKPMMQSSTNTYAPSSSSSQSPPPTTLSSSDAHILSIQEAARLAAEEDKRRRNTAASARFRIKKKQRDQAIEKAAKEMESKVSDLERKISQLELENRWLRNLLVEKNSAVAEAGVRRGV